MKVNVEDIGACRKRLHIELEKEEVLAELDNTYRELSTGAQIPGFRKGHAPRKLLEKRFGKSVDEDVKKKLMEEHFKEAVKENKLEPLLDPKFDNVEYTVGEVLVFDAEVDVRPTFEMPE